jgi:tRNA A37 N6-isopentenylltransferase MiaA
MVERGVQKEVAAALAEPLSSTARKVIGLEEFATLRVEDAVAAVALKTRQYAAYQRKWLRRIPGVVSVPADRPPDAVADEILEVARARQRLPARRAG